MATGRVHNSYIERGVCIVDSRQEAQELAIHSQESGGASGKITHALRQIATLYPSHPPLRLIVAS